jgi:outer membrane protein assembly factor BamB
MKTRMSACFLVIFVFTICTQHGLADDYDWPRWRGPNGDGISNETDWNPEALNGGPKILWKVDVGMGHSNVAVKDSRLYTMGIQSRRAVILCLKADTGEEVWRYYFDEQYQDPLSTPTIDGKYVFAISKAGIVACLKAKNGKLLWKKDLVNELESAKAHHGYASSPVIEGNLIILNAKTSGIALNKKTGDKVWEGEVNTDSRGDYFATPIIYDFDENRYALLFSDSGLFSMEVETGRQLWFYEWTQKGSPNVADPVVFDNSVFISSSETNSRCVLLDIEGNNPSTLWQNKNMNNHVSTSIYIDGYIYGIAGNYFVNIKYCSLRCISSQTGEVMWENEMRGASLTAADGKLIILEDDGTLHIAEAIPSGYKEVSSGDVLEGELKNRMFWTPPVLCNGKIYCRNFTGDLICIDVSK